MMIERERAKCLLPFLQRSREKRQYAVTLINRFQLLIRAISITHPSVDLLGASGGCFENTIDDASRDLDKAILSRQNVALTALSILRKSFCLFELEMDDTSVQDN